MRRVLILFRIHSGNPFSKKTINTKNYAISLEFFSEKLVIFNTEKYEEFQKNDKISVEKFNLRNIATNTTFSTNFHEKSRLYKMQCLVISQTISNARLQGIVYFT